MKKTPISDPIAIQELLWIQKDGKEVLLTVKVGRPYQVDADSWACPAELCGLDSQYADIHGLGSMQALGLAVGLLKTWLGHLLEDGESLYYPEDRQSMFDRQCMDAVFGK